MIFLIVPPVLAASSMGPGGSQVNDHTAPTPLKKFAHTFGMEVLRSTNQLWVLRRPGSRLILQQDSRKAFLNDVMIWQHVPLSRVKRTWSISVEDVRRTWKPLLDPSIYLTNVGYRVVVLDPGHGGNDSGVTGLSGVQEKWITLDVARRVRKHLARAGLRVILTRESDRAMPLAKRAEKAVESHADIFVSIHMNGSTNRQANGLETYVLSSEGHASTNDDQSKTPRAGIQESRASAPNIILAYALQKRMLERLGTPDRGVRRARFRVLRDAPCPAALVECGFLSNPNEEAMLKGDARREEVALALAEGILEYVRLVQQTKLKHD